jgi:hypothetical protein
MILLLGNSGKMECMGKRIYSKHSQKYRWYEARYTVGNFSAKKQDTLSEICLGRGKKRCHNFLSREGQGTLSEIHLRGQDILYYGKGRIAVRNLSRRCKKHFQKSVCTESGCSVHCTLPEIYLGRGKIHCHKSIWKGHFQKSVWEGKDVCQKSAYRKMQETLSEIY